MKIGGAQVEDKTKVVWQRRKGRKEGVGAGVLGRCCPPQTPSPPPDRAHLAQLAPLGLRALQVCKGCPVREEQLALLGPRETG